MKKSTDQNSFYSVDFESFDHMLWLFHRLGFDPGPKFNYFLLRDFMSRSRWPSFKMACDFLKSYLEKKEEKK